MLPNCADKNVATCSTCFLIQTQPIGGNYFLGNRQWLMGYLTFICTFCITLYIIINKSNFPCGINKSIYYIILFIIVIIIITYLALLGVMCNDVLLCASHSYSMNSHITHCRNTSSHFRAQINATGRIWSICAEAVLLKKTWLKLFLSWITQGIWLYTQGWDCVR